MRCSLITSYRPEALIKYSLSRRCPGPSATITSRAPRVLNASNAASITAGWVLITPLGSNSTRFGLSSTRLPLSSKRNISTPRRTVSRNELPYCSAARMATRERLVLMKASFSQRTCCSQPFRNGYKDAPADALMNSRLFIFTSHSKESRTIAHRQDSQCDRLGFAEKFGFGESLNESLFQFCILLAIERQANCTPTQSQP